jgi:hypothetical protein
LGHWLPSTGMITSDKWRKKVSSFLSTLHAQAPLTLRHEAGTIKDPGYYNRGWNDPPAVDASSDKPATRRKVSYVGLAPSPAAPGAGKECCQQNSETLIGTLSQACISLPTRRRRVPLQPNTQSLPRHPLEVLLPASHPI